MKEVFTAMIAGFAIAVSAHADLDVTATSRQFSHVCDQVNFQPTTSLNPLNQVIAPSQNHGTIERSRGVYLLFQRNFLSELELSLLWMKTLTGSVRNS